MTLKARDLRTWDRVDDGRTIWRLNRARGSDDVLVTTVTLRLEERIPRPGAWEAQNPHTARYGPDEEIHVMRWVLAPDGAHGVPYDLDGNGHRWPDGPHSPIALSGLLDP